MMSQKPEVNCPPKRKPNDVLSERRWNIMRVMGYEKGQGLGVNAQGMVDPVALSQQKGRRGLGLATGSAPVTTSTPSHSEDPRLVWTPEHDTLWTDRIWTWSRFGDNNIGNSRSIDFVQDFLLPLDDPRSRGPPITEINNQTTFCSGHILQELLKYKDQLDSLSTLVVTQSHERSNPFEHIKKGIFMNRAAMKLANIDSLTNGMFSNAVDKESILYFADVCAGPGGFSEYLLWRRCNAVPVDCELESDPNPTYKLQKSLLNAKGFGFTLVGDCDFRENDFIAGPPEAFFAHYGPSTDGDITKWTNLASFASLVARSTDHNGVHVLVADGGFDVSAHYNLQEVLSKRIYLCQCLCALTVLQPGGHFLTKIFDTFTEFTVDLIYLLSQVFEEISIIKPVTSRPANSERYLLCKNLFSPSSQMAGCPVVPKDYSSKKDASDGNREKKIHMMPGRGRPTAQQLANGDSAVDKEEAGILDLTESGPLGELIKHLLCVNEALREPDEKESSKQDVLRLCQLETIEQDHSFVEFITNVNSEFAEFQCIALSKLLKFTSNPQFTEDRQAEQRQRCLTAWKISPIERRHVAWPILSQNHSHVIHDLLGDSEKFRSLNALARDSVPTNRLRPLESFDDSRIMQLMASGFVLVCATPSYSISFQRLQPMLIYSRHSQFNDIHCTTDGKQWQRLDQVLSIREVRLPAGTLVWGQFTYEYTMKGTRRKHSLMLYDALCIYGHDCRHLPYTNRMEMVKRMVQIVNFPPNVSSIRTAPMVSFPELANYKEKLPHLWCKDANGTVPMYRHSDGAIFRPHSLLLVKFIADAWDGLISRSTGMPYYFNRITKVTTFHLPLDQYQSVVHTEFTHVPWKADHADEIDVNHVIEHLLKFFNTTHK